MGASDLGNLGATLAATTGAPETIKNNVDGLLALVDIAVSVLPLLELVVVVMFAVFCRSTMPLEEKHLAGS